MTGRPIAEEDLHAYVDDVLDAARRAEVSSYLKTHPKVEERVGAYRAERELLRDALAPAVDEPVPPELNVRRMIEASRRSSGGPRWAMGVAAAVLLALGGMGGWMLHGMDNPSPSGLTALGAEAAASFTVYAPDKRRPVEIRASDRSLLAAWVTERIGRAITIPELAAVGYRFMGGRVVSTPHGAAALFMYDDDKGNRLAMLARPMPDAKESSMTSLAVGDVRGFAWSESGFGYSMVGAVSPDALRPLADEVRRQIKASA